MRGKTRGGGSRETITNENRIGVDQLFNGFNVTPISLLFKLSAPPSEFSSFAVLFIALPYVNVLFRLLPSLGVRLAAGGFSGLRASRSKICASSTAEHPGRRRRQMKRRKR